MNTQLKPSEDEALEAQIEDVYNRALHAENDADKCRLLTEMSELCASRSEEQKQRMEDQKGLLK